MPHTEIMAHVGARHDPGPSPEGRGGAGEDAPSPSQVTLPNGKLLSIERMPLVDGGFIIRCAATGPGPGDAGEDIDWRFLGTALECMADGVRIFDRGLRLVYFNELAKELSFYPEELFRIGTHYREYMRFSQSQGCFIDDPEYVEERLRQTLAGNAPDVEQVLPDGRVVRKTRRLIPGGGLISTYTDITELKTAEAEASRQSELIRTVVERINHGVRVIGPDGNLVLWNKRYQEIFGYPDELLEEGRPYSEITRFNSRRIGRSEEEVEFRVARRLKRNRLKARRNRVKKYRDDLVIHQNMEPMPGGGFITTYTDITQLEQARAQAIEEMQRADLANRSKSDFLANMSHELRTPLNAIMGYSEMTARELKGPIGTPCYRDYAARILESAGLLLELINDILDVSKIEAGKVDIEPRPMKLEETIRSCLAMTAERADEKSLEIDVQLPDGLPRLLADPRLIKQILLNLLSNAVKFTEPGGRVTVEARLTDDGCLHLTVADTGIGISEDMIGAVLEPFTQIDNALTKRFEGAGLGLTIVQSLVSLLGGKFELHSTPGEGTRATVRLPVATVSD